MHEKLAINGGPKSVIGQNLRLWPFYSERTGSIVARKIGSGQVFATNFDPDIEKFEESFAKKLCPEHYALFCSSGTSALMTAYFALGLDSGSEVLVQSNTFRTTATPLFLLNLVPVLCDSNDDGSLSIEDAERQITNKTQAIVVTHMWGQTTDLVKLKELATKYSLPFVEDCSHAHGLKWDGQPIGTFGDIGVFSLGTKKMISGGIGGMLVTRDRELFEKAALFSQPKPKAAKFVKASALLPYLSSGLGTNFRGSPISAVLAQNHLDRLDETIQIKNGNLSRLSRIIMDKLPELRPIVKNTSITNGTWYSYPCTWNGDYATRDQVVRVLKAEGVAVNTPGDVLHEMKLFRAWDKRAPLTTYRATLPNKQRICGGVNALFSKLIMWPTTEMYEICDSLLESYSFAMEKVRYCLSKDIR